MTTDPNSLAYDAAATVHRARQPFPPGSGSVTNDQPGSISIDDLTLRFSKQDVDEAYDRGLTQGLMHAVEHISRLLGHEVVLDISREAAEGMLASALDTAREAGRRQAVEAVRAQADLPDLVHFDRPSDFRKGVLSCLAALEALEGKPDA